MITFFLIQLVIVMIILEFPSNSLAAGCKAHSDCQLNAHCVDIGGSHGVCLCRWNYRFVAGKCIRLVPLHREHKKLANHHVLHRTNGIGWQTVIGHRNSKTNTVAAALKSTEPINTTTLSTLSSETVAALTTLTSVTTTTSTNIESTISVPSETTTSSSLSMANDTITTVAPGIADVSSPAPPAPLALPLERVRLIPLPPSISIPPRDAEFDPEPAKKQSKSASSLPSPQHFHNRKAQKHGSKTYGLSLSSLVSSIDGTEDLLEQIIASRIIQIRQLPSKRSQLLEKKAIIQEHITYIEAGKLQDSISLDIETLLNSISDSPFWRDFPGKASLLDDSPYNEPRLVFQAEVKESLKKFLLTDLKEQLEAISSLLKEKDSSPHAHNWMVPKYFYLA